MTSRFLWPRRKGRLESSSSFCRGYKRNVEKNPGLIKSSVCTWLRPLASCVLGKLPPLFDLCGVCHITNHLILRSMGVAQVPPLTTVGPLLLASLLVLLLVELVPSNSIPSIPSSGHSSGRQSLADPLPSL